MEIRTEYHKTQKTLFRRINQLKKAKGLYRFEVNDRGYNLQYCESENMDNVFVVLKGKDDLPFKLYDSQDECSFVINNGDVLIYECESNNKVWFSYAKWLTGLYSADPEQAIGYTDYGPLLEMIQAGLIANVGQVNELPLTVENEKKEETQPEPDIPQDDWEGINEVFDRLGLLLKNINLKDALDAIGHITGYSVHQGVDRIQMYKVAHRPGCTSRNAPQLRFGGRWMKRAGFDVGQNVKIVTINGMILIVSIHPPECEVPMDY